MRGSATAGPNTSITLTDLAAALAAYLGRQLGAEASVSGLRRLPGGASRETWLFTLATPDGGAERLVLRRDPPGHVIELQVGQVDAPTWRPDNLPSSLAISSVHVRFPTHRAGTITLQPAA